MTQLVSKREPLAIRMVSGIDERNSLPSLYDKDARYLVFKLIEVNVYA